MTDTIGQPITRVDGPAKVTGKAKYAAEFAPEGLAYAALVESSIAAGTIKAINSKAAERAPGVLLVLTYRNAPRLPYLPPKERPAVEPVAGEALKVLQDTRILFSGQPIGVVVAGTQSQAESAASLVRVEYEAASNALTAFDPARAQPASAAAEKKGRGPESRQGDSDGAFAAAPFKVDQSYIQPREHHNAMEPHATMAQWQGDTLTLWDKTQWVYNDADEIARAFGIPAESVRGNQPVSRRRVWIGAAHLAPRHPGRAGRTTGWPARAPGVEPATALFLDRLPSACRTARPVGSGQ